MRIIFILIRGKNYSHYFHSFLNICTKLLFYHFFPIFFAESLYCDMKRYLLTDFISFLTPSGPTTRSV